MTQPPVRRHLRDAVGRARVSASTLKDICEALRGAGCAPPPEAPAAPVDVEDVAAQSEMAEAAELDAVRREAAARPLASVDPVAGATEQSDEARLTARIEHFRQLKAARAAEDEKEGARQDALVKRVRASLAADEARLQQELAKMTEYESTLSTRQTEAAASLAQGEAALGPSREAEARNAGKARRALAEKRRREEKAARRGREQADAQRARKADIQLRGVGAGDPWELLVQPLVKQAVAGEPWDDYVFPAADPSLPPSKFGARWESAAQVFSSISVFADGGGETDPVETSDIVQGALGTSYLMSALAIAASRPQLIRDCFVTKEPNDAGLYCVRLFRDGLPRHVMVNDQLPMAADGSTPLFASSKREGELWISLLEKAYAKLYGSYAAIEGGHVDEALLDLTGGVSGESIALSSAASNLDALWDRLRFFSHAGYLLGAGAPTGCDTERSRRSTRLGLVAGHAYSIGRVVEESGHRLLQLRNPWGEAEWIGDWSDRSPLWTPRLKARLGWADAQDGTFWMCLRDFCGQFASLYVCRLQPKHWALAEAEGEWRGTTAGGCANYDTFGDNPQYAITIGTKPVPCLITLAQDLACEGDSRVSLDMATLAVAASADATSAQTDAAEAASESSTPDGTSDEGVGAGVSSDVGAHAGSEVGGAGEGVEESAAAPAGSGQAQQDEALPIGFAVVFKNGERVRKIYYSDWCAQTAPYRDVREVSLDVMLEPIGVGRSTTYTLLPTTFAPGQTRGFHIRLYSKVPVKLAALPEPDDGANEVVEAPPISAPEASPPEVPPSPQVVDDAARLTLPPPPDLDDDGATPRAAAAPASKASTEDDAARGTNASELSV